MEIEVLITGVLMTTVTVEAAINLYNPIASARCHAKPGWQYQQINDRYKCVKCPNVCVERNRVENFPCTYMDSVGYVDTQCGECVPGTCNEFPDSTPPEVFKTTCVPCPAGTTVGSLDTIRQSTQSTSTELLYNNSDLTTIVCLALGGVSLLLLVLGLLCFWIKRHRRKETPGTASSTEDEGRMRTYIYNDTGITNNHHGNRNERDSASGDSLSASGTSSSSVVTVHVHSGENSPALSEHRRATENNVYMEVLNVNERNNEPHPPETATEGTPEEMESMLSYDTVVPS